MKKRELVHMAVKARSAVDYILETSPDQLKNKEAVERLRNFLPAPSQPVFPEVKELTVLPTESK